MAKFTFPFCSLPLIALTILNITAARVENTECLSTGVSRGLQPLMISCFTLDELNCSFGAHSVVIRNVVPYKGPVSLLPLFPQVKCCNFSYV